MSRFHTIATVLSLVLAAPALAADADARFATLGAYEQMLAQVREVQIRRQKAPWIKHWVLAAPRAVDARDSADTWLQALVAGYDQATLDRGGWRNAMFPEGHYAATELLLTAVVGSGVTTPGADNSTCAARIAGR